MMVSFPLGGPSVNCPDATAVMPSSCPPSKYRMPLIHGAVFNGGRGKAGRGGRVPLLRQRSRGRGVVAGAPHVRFTKLLLP